MTDTFLWLSGAFAGATMMLPPVFTMRRALAAITAERDILQEAKDSLALSLRAAEMSRDQAISTGKRLGEENVELQREAGRYAAELRAANQRLARFDRPRGKGGRFTAKESPKPKPIACA